MSNDEDSAAASEEDNPVLSAAVAADELLGRSEEVSSDEDKGRKFANPADQFNKSAAKGIP